MTKSFTENLAALPEVTHLAGVSLTNATGTSLLLENKPGSAGSVRLYAYLAAKHGAINVAASEEGVMLYAEHSADARANPGKHPNIDRLFGVLAGGEFWQVQPVLAE